MQDRLSAAEDFLKQQKYEEATREFEWLWDNMERVDPGMSGVRVSFMAGTIKELVGRDPPARLRFAEIRDRTESLADADLPNGAKRRFDWIVLNEILSEQERTLMWFDSVKGDARYATVLDKITHRRMPAACARVRRRRQRRMEGRDRARATLAGSPRK